MHTPADISNFHRFGYLIWRGCFSAARTREVGAPFPPDYERALGGSYHFKVCTPARLR